MELESSWATHPAWVPTPMVNVSCPLPRLYAVTTTERVAPGSILSILEDSNCIFPARDWPNSTWNTTLHFCDEPSRPMILKSTKLPDGSESSGVTSNWKVDCPLPLL